MVEKRLAQEDLCYIPRLLKEHWLAEGRITDEQVNYTVTDMWPYDPGFLNEQRALYQTVYRTREDLSIVLGVVACQHGQRT